MSRSLAFATALPFLSLTLTGCAAQEERRNLEGSITRLEQRLERTDEYLKSLQNGQAQQRQERSQELQEAQNELRRMRDALAAQEKESEQARRQAESLKQELQRWQKDAESGRQRAEQDMQKMQAEASKERSRLETELQAARKRGDEQAAKFQEQSKELRRFAAEHEEKAKAHQSRAAAVEAEAKAAVTQARREAEERTKETRARTEAMQAELEAMRAELQKSQDGKQQEAAEQRRDRERAIERLIAERREIEQLRQSVVRDLAAAREPAVAQPSRGLSSMVARPVTAPSPAPAAHPTSPNAPSLLVAAPSAASPASNATPTSITVNNGSGEVHFHFHGMPPTVNVVRGEATPKVLPPVRGRDAIPEPTLDRAGPTPPLRLRLPSAEAVQDPAVEVRVQPKEVSPKKKGKDEAPRSELKINEPEAATDTSLVLDFVPAPRRIF